MGESAEQQARRAAADARFWNTKSTETWAEIKRGIQAPGYRIQTGFPTLDRAFGRGLVASTSTVIAGIESSGKSALALEIALAAMHRGDRAAVLNLDMEGKQWLLRLLSRISGISTAEILEQDQLDYLWLERLRDSMDKIAGFEGALLVTRELEPSLPEVLAAFDDAAVLGARIVVVDFVQVVRAQTRENRVTELEDVVRALVGAARHHGVVEILLSQLNRKAREAERPRLFHALGGSALEHHCDGGIILDHTNIVPITEDWRRRKFVARIEKNRVTGRKTPAWDFWIEYDEQNLRMTEAGRIPPPRPAKPKAG